MPTCDLNKLFNDVYETDDFLVYFINSSRKGVPPHRVDLQKYSGNGGCSCEAFQFRFNKLLRQRAMPSPSLECSHIKKAKRFLLFKILNEAIERREQQSEQNKKARRLDIGLSKTASSIGKIGRAAPAKEAGQWPDDEDCPY